MDPAEREAAVRRNMVRLMVAEPMLRAVLTLTFTIAIISVVRFSGRDAFSGLLSSTNSVLVAIGSFTAGRAMDRVGRRPGLAAGYLTILVGCGLAAAASAFESAVALIAAIGVIGFGTGAANLGRGAAADMHPPERRAAAVGRVLAVGTVGAVVGPLLAAGVQHSAREWFGLDPLVLPWAVTGLLAFGGLLAVLSLRPDPRDLSVAAADGTVDEGTRRSLGELWAVRPFRVAVIAMGASQAAMVGVMGITPVEIGHHGGGSVAVGGAISLHVAGMFAFSPFVGLALDRWGRRPGMVVGTVTSAAGAILAAAAHGRLMPLIAGLFLVGLGWSGTYLATTSMVSDLTAASERAGALGFLDLVAAASAATGALIAGFMLEWSGYASVGWTVAALLAPVLLLVSALPTPRPAEPAA
ncbi:MAG: MFS transporter [Actinobacteria bacterium]|nr:MFS transporter [Actinomycetota bacterium]